MRKGYAISPFPKHPIVSQQSSSHQARSTLVYPAPLTYPFPGPYSVRPDQAYSFCSFPIIIQGVRSSSSPSIEEEVACCLYWLKFHQPEFPLSIH